MAVIRALLLNGRLSAGGQYRDIVAALTPEVQAIKAEAEGLVSNSVWLERATEEGKRWASGVMPSALGWLGPQIVGALDIFRKRQSPAQQGGFEAFDAKATEFARRWLFGSETGRQVLWALATIDAAGVDPLAIDWARAERSPTWKAAYGENRTRPSRTRHKQLMDGLKKQSWTTLKDPELLQTACHWVECRLIYGSESEWLRAKGQAPGPEYNVLTVTSKRFRPFDDALGIRRPRGRPPQL